MIYIFKIYINSLIGVRTGNPGTSNGPLAMITVVGRHSTTLHMHMAHGAMASHMQVFNVIEEGGRASFMLQFSGSSDVEVSHSIVYNLNLDTGRLVASCGVGDMLLMVFHWVIVILASAQVTLFGYVFSFCFCCLAPMDSPIILLVFWRKVYVMRLKVRRKKHRDLWMAIEDFYQGLAVLYTLASICYGILISRTDILWTRKLCTC